MPRPRNDERNRRMLAALDLARSGEFPSRVEPFGLDPWPKWPGTPEVPLDRQIRVMAAVAQVVPRFLVSEAGRQFIPAERLDEFLDALAAALPEDGFLLRDETAVLTLVEIMALRVTKSGGRRDQKMLEFQQAASIFNSQLADAQTHRLRLDEKPVTWAAIQRLDSRITQKRSKSYV